MTTTNSFIDKFSAEEDEAIYDPSVEENNISRSHNWA